MFYMYITWVYKVLFLTNDVNMKPIIDSTLFDMFQRINVCLYHIKFKCTLPFGFM